MARVAVGLAIEDAKTAFAEIASSCAHVDTVQRGGMRTLPRTPGNVYVQPTRTITPRTTRGTITLETFDLPFMVEATRPARNARPPVQQEDLDEADLLAVSAARWEIANEIAEAVAANPRRLRTISADVAVTAEDAGFVDSTWVARAWCVIRCAAGPIG